MIRLIAAALVGLMSISPSSAQDAKWESVRIFEIGGTRLYVPVKWIAIGSGSAKAEFIPPYDVKFPAYTVFIAKRGIQIGLHGRRFTGDTESRSPEVWPDLHVSLVDLLPGGRPSEIEFRERFVENSIPKNTKFHCDKNYFGRKSGFDYCDAERMALIGIRIRYRWAGNIVNPNDWDKMDRRMQKVVEWLAMQPDQRLSVIEE